MAKRYGYYPEDEETAYRAESFLDGLNDFTSLLGRTYNDPDEEKKQANLKKVFSEDLPKFLSVIEKRLTSNSNPHFLAGDSLTTADFGFAAVLFSLFHNEHNPFSAQVLPILDSFPKVKAYALNLKDVVLKDYLAQRPPRFF